MDSFQPRQTDKSQTITAKQAIACVEELAAANYGPIGVINFEFIPLPDDESGRANWDLVFRPSPANAEAANDRRRMAIQRAVEQVKIACPKVRWP